LVLLWLLLLLQHHVPLLLFIALTVAVLEG
jgi:hypothetical protein